MSIKTFFAVVLVHAFEERLKQNAFRSVRNIFHRGKYFDAVVLQVFAMNRHLVLITGKSIKFVNRKGETMAKAIICALSGFPKEAVKTITCDRGSEFACWREIEKALKCDMYFADPYCAWQKGTNENLNGLLREFYPKGRNLSRVSPATLSKYPPLKWGLWKALKGKVTGAALKRRTKLAYRTQASRALYSFLLDFFLLFSSHCLNGS